VRAVGRPGEAKRCATLLCSVEITYQTWVLSALRGPAKHGIVNGDFFPVVEGFELLCPVVSCPLVQLGNDGCRRK
jgi:hypothetical protein